MSIRKAFERRVREELSTAANLHRFPDGEYEDEGVRLAWRLFGNLRPVNLLSFHRVSDQSVELSFSSCRAASEFIKGLRDTSVSLEYRSPRE